MDEPTVAFHGTPAGNIDSIGREGLRPGSWMALDAAEARHHGGVTATVFQVDLTQLDGTWPREDDGSLSWQSHTNDQVIPVSALTFVP